MSQCLATYKTHIEAYSQLNLEFIVRTWYWHRNNGTLFPYTLIYTIFRGEIRAGPREILHIATFYFYKNFCKGFNIQLLIIWKSQNLSYTPSCNKKSTLFVWKIIYLIFFLNHVTKEERSLSTLSYNE